MRHIPNILSGIRILLVGVFVGWFRAGKYLPALCVFLLAFLTDLLDGYLARRNGWVSDVGKLLDPFADKLMTVAALICIYLEKHQLIYLVLFLVMLVKELLMLVGSIIMVKRKVVAMADWPGKLATGCFTVGIVTALVSFVHPAFRGWDMAFLTAATVLSCFALVYYAKRQFPGVFSGRADGEG